MICCLSGTIAVVCLMILSVIGCFFPCLFGCMVRHNYGTISYDIGFYYCCLRCISKENPFFRIALSFCPTESDNLHFLVLMVQYFLLQDHTILLTTTLQAVNCHLHISNLLKLLFCPLWYYLIYRFSIVHKISKMFLRKSTFVLAIPCLIREVSPIDVIPNAQHNSVFP